eukprot:9016924-Prorocentrum_lima.AAC.1
MPLVLSRERTRHRGWQGKDHRRREGESRNPEERVCVVKWLGCATPGHATITPTPPWTFLH